MKVIDLLVKMANKEIEDGFKFKISDYEYFIEHNKIYYVNDEGITCELKQIKFMCLNDAIEIIEEKPKKIDSLGLFSDEYEEKICLKIEELIQAVNCLREKSDKNE